MSAGFRCDAPACGTFSADAPGWLVLGRHLAVPSVMAALGMDRTDPWTFCSARCVMEFAYLMAVEEGSGTGTEPPPRSGIGWPS